MAGTKRLIDANKFCMHLADVQLANRGWRDDVCELLDDVMEALDEHPTVDAVEVVRCKNCDWYREHEDSICVNPKCGKSWYGCPVPPEHFCSYGERKDNERKAD